MKKEKRMLTLKIRIMPNKSEEKLLKEATALYIQTVNNLVDLRVASATALKISSKDINADLPSAVKNQAIRDSSSIYNKYKKSGIQPVLKKPICVWNNQNYAVEDNIVSFPLSIAGKCTRFKIKAHIKSWQRDALENHKLGTMRIVLKSGKWIAQVAYEPVIPELIKSNNVMGIDLGINVPAVAVTNTGKVKFFGNGRRNRFVRRKYKTIRKELGKAKKLKKIIDVDNKEQRYMTDQDHKTSREIVNFAKENNVSVIRLERLSGIRQTAKTSRKNRKDLQMWSFYRLISFIEYKAELEGIKVEIVNPYNTSKSCPSCGKINIAKKRSYVCSCGFKAHRDLVGATNIIKAPAWGAKKGKK